MGILFMSPFVCLSVCPSWRKFKVSGVCGEVGGGGYILDMIMRFIPFKYVNLSLTWLVYGANQLCTFNMKIASLTKMLERLSICPPVHQSLSPPTPLGGI